MTWPTLRDIIESGATGWHRVTHLQDPSTERWVYLADARPVAVVHGYPGLGAVWWHPPLGLGNVGATWCATVEQAKDQAVPS